MHLCAVKLESLREQLPAFTWVKAFSFKKKLVIELVQDWHMVTQWQCFQGNVKAYSKNREVGI